MAPRGDESMDTPDNDDDGHAGSQDVPRPVCTAAAARGAGGEGSGATVTE